MIPTIQKFLDYHSIILMCRRLVIIQIGEKIGGCLDLSEGCLVRVSYALAPVGGFRKLGNWQMDMLPKSFRKRYMNPFGLDQLGRYAIAVVSGSVNNSTNSVGITLPLNTTQQLAKLQMPQLRVTESEEHTATRLLLIFSFDGSSPELRFD